MDKIDIKQKIDEIEKEIAILPPGNIAIKKVKDKDYFYHRYTINGKRKEIYIDFDNVDELRNQINKRKTLENELKKIKLLLPKKAISSKKKNNFEFKTNIRIGEQLERWASLARDFKHRECYNKLKDYVFEDDFGHVFILYGLRRTGKTTLIRQIVLNMSPKQRKKAAFIQISSKDTLFDLNSDLKYLEKNGYVYVFIDEITLLNDFIDGAALFSDIYATSGMKIVLSGTDSLGFIFSKSEQLYDRCIMLHTTFISYREFENVLGIKGIDNFIHYGGTMSMEGVYYNENSSFATKKKTDEYIDTAIARNIQHSLKHYQDGDHFHLLFDLFNKGELTSAINRIVEDINHRFTKEVLTKTFRSNMLSSTARNLLKNRDGSFDLLDNIDPDFVNDSIKKMLDILEKDEQNIEVGESHAIEIKEYLLLLDMIMEIDQYRLPNVNDKQKKIIITQPGLRFAQVKSLIDSLLLDEKFNNLSIDLRNQVLERAISTVKGRMMEDLVLLETKIAKPNKEVFQLQFAIGEFDMVVYDPKTLTCEIYEIKYNKNVVPNQYSHLIDTDKCAACEYRYGPITNKYVIYRGEDKDIDGIKYLNVEKYLNDLI